MLNKKQFRNLIIRTLQHWPELISDNAIELLLGTAAQESAFGTHIRQIGGGPGLGVMQVEPNTFEWLRGKYGSQYGFEDRKAEELEWDLRLSILIARLRYRVVQEPLPNGEDVKAMAAYWNKYYNCNPDYGTDQEFIDNYRKHVVFGV